MNAPVKSPSATPAIEPMWIEDAWYMACWPSEIADGKVVARTILGEPVAIYRQADGGVAALEDRCCHRLAPLSMGRIEGNDLRCMYHGLKFDPAGQCNEVPGQDRIPPSLKVRAYPAVEKQGVVWIWTGEPSAAKESEILDWPYLDHPDWRKREGYIHYKSNYMLIVDNLLDFSHLAFVHEKTIGSQGLATSKPVVEHTPAGLRIERIMNSEPRPPFLTALGMMDPVVDRWNIYNWHVRGNALLMDSGFAPVGYGGHTSDRKGCVEFRHFSIQTPETVNTSHYFFAHPHNWGFEHEGLTDKLHAGVVEAFQEDRSIIEAQQRVIDLNPYARMAAIGHDVGVFQARRLIESLAKRLG